MKRILVLGRSGSGKTTFSDQLGKVLGRPVTHLDNLFWKPGWIRAYTTREWEEVVRDLINQDEWILDGNYHNTLEMRLARADTVVLFEAHPLIALYRALKRKYFPPQESADTVPGLHNEVGLSQLVKTIFTFPAKDLRQKIKASGITPVFVIRTKRDSDNLFKKLK